MLLSAAAGTSCGAGRAESKPPIVQPGAPGQTSRVIPAEQAADLSKVRYTQADAEFMQGMISHHAQALEMTALVPARSASEGLQKLAHRIELSQDDEIQMMQGWLRARGENAPDVKAHHAHGAHLMPGMLTPEEMARLAEAKGTEFDRLFLDLMIKHHQGALTMVENLLVQPGAGQDSDIFGFISDINADQSMEIARMGAMLGELSR
jgi:uncharacterized protein (DUF305 family)